MNDKTTLVKKWSDRIDATGQKLSDLGTIGTIMKDVDLMPPISEEGKSIIIKSTQDSILNIHKSTVEYTAGMTVKNIESIASIGIAHESKASESIQAIERMTLAGQKSLLEESKSSKKGVFGAALLALGVIGGALTTYQRLKK
ncbi:hypothetical protein [Pectobacterium versatile]|uniref:hypothetical protein n=1 Tax=Pectobacterium versatile TaxID=2488639 RepID=UPI00102EBA3E|nr:hypothetical protein [Pectobacterium versatile]TAI85747.1 hypothetical protein EG330_08555 [Pectobacterium versatile]